MVLINTSNLFKSKINENINFITLPEHFNQDVFKILFKFLYFQKFNDANEIA